jgi:hypothetical protein
MSSARSEGSERSNQTRIAPRVVLRRREGTCFLFPSDDEVGALQGAIRAERGQRAEQSNSERAQRAEQSTEPWANVGPRIAGESGEMIGVMRAAR